MKEIYIGNGETATDPCVATIGFFDGVHMGHRYLISQVTEAAHSMSLKAMVITFDEHPRRVLHAAFQPQLLTTNAEKRQLFIATGIDTCAILHFDEATAALTAQQFMANVLRKRLNVRVLIIGYDNRFGHNRSEGFDDYVRYGHDCGIEVRKAEALTLGGVNVSSSVVRALLKEGSVERAARCLGYNYFMDGKVIHGVRVGRRLGFPTANIEPCDGRKMVPAVGVYAVRVLIDGEPAAHRAIMNIGTRPTFGGSGMSMEVNIFGFEGDIYGRTMRVEFVHRLRAERKFDSADELARHIAADKERAEQLFDADDRQDK